jgi:uncharacterized protein (DUF885 family)
MRKFAFLIISLPLLAMVQLKAQETLQFKIDALKKSGDKKEEKERADLLYKIYLDYTLQNFPEFGTFIGKPTDNARWTDLSMQAYEQRKKDRDLFIKAIASIDKTKLDKSELLSYELLKKTLEQDKEGEKYAIELMPMNQMNGYHQQIMQVISLTSITTEKDATDLLSRLDKIPVLVDQLISLMNEGIKRKITAPKATLAGVPAQIQNLITSNPAESIFIEEYKKFAATQPAEKQKALNDAAIKSVTQNVYPSLEKLKTYMEKVYIPKATETIALKDLPDGENWYNYNIKVTTTTNLTYQQIHDMGLKEVKRIRISMDSLIKTTGFKGSFKEFCNFLRTDPRFFYDSAKQLLDGYKVIAKDIDQMLPKFFGKLPRLPYGVVPVPSYDEKTQTTAYYMPGSPELGRSGNFYANTYDLKSRPKWGMEALTIHEAVPGHHLQIALAQEMGNVPEFRKYNFYTAFVEGWGLYSESLGNEMGFYKDPYSKFGQLTFEMWRAVRLVVDTGIHGLGWTRDQAIDYFKENSANAEHDIVVEVDRYVSWPSQALAYKIGELKIKELRARAVRELGDKFDIRAFHDAVLENGAIPLDVLEHHINSWIQIKKRS